MKMTLFEGLPSRFKGDDSDVDDAEIWMKKFKIVSALNKWDEETKFNIFKLWLEGKAAKWLESREAIHEEIRMMVDWERDFLSEFNESKSKQKGNLITLCQLKINSGETISQFNSRYIKYLNAIPKNMYTPDWIKEAYISTLSNIDKDVWWKLAQENDSMTYSQIMKEAERLIKLKITHKSFNINDKSFNEDHNQTLDSEKEKTYRIKENLDSNSKLLNDYKKIDKIVNQVDSLSESMKNLHLLVQKNQNADYSQVTCMNCSMKGHPTFKCWEKPKTGQSLAKDLSEKAAKSGLLAIKKQTEPLIAASANKRMRVESLLGEDYRYQNQLGSEKIVPDKLQEVKNRLGAVPKKKKKTIQKYPPAIFTRIMDSPAPVSLLEFCQIKPQMIPDIISGLQSLKREKIKRNALWTSEISAEESEEEEDEEPEPVSFILLEAANQILPVFLDIGAAHSIIKRSMVMELSLPTFKLKKPFALQPVSGPSFLVSEGVVIHAKFEEDIIIPIEFVVIEKGPVPIILGLDVCQRLYSNINYKDETFTIEIDGKNYATQIYSRETLLNNHEILFEDVLYAENDDSSKLIMYTSIKAEIQDSENTESTSKNRSR
ncbi:hypothetical protein AYI69_g1019 [Smittium culicis]|uniref:Uncharacterized protein n=1 Tax=Smittium culicis TaxID=133412 RepID=A0A1R1YRG2_9FUNG|nr:hypothetical protein AYI69_g1019 [Smittium culicis]